MRFQSVLFKGDPNDEDARYDWALKHQRTYSKQELFYDWDPEMKILESYSYDEQTGVVTIKRQQDCTTVLSDNAEWRQSEQTWKKKEDRWLRYASIPLIVVEMWMAEGIDVFKAETDRHGRPNEHLKAVLKKLRDPDWQHLKTVDMDMGDGATSGSFALGLPSSGNMAPGYFPTLPEDSMPRKAQPLKPKRYL